MPRVLQILNRTNIGGPVLIVSLLTRYMPNEFETIFVSGCPAASERNADELLNSFGITPLYMPEMGRELNPFNDWATYRKIKQLIKDFKPDIVHTHAAKPGVVGRLAASAMKVPVIIHTFHGHVFHSYFSRAKTRLFIEVEKWLAKKSTKIIAISPLQKKELAEDFKIAPASKIEVVPLGLQLDAFQTNQQAKRQAFRNEFGIDANTIAISIVGRLAPVKNHGLFVRAIHHLQQHTAKSIKAFIVGGGECQSEIIKLCESLGLRYSSPESINHEALVILTNWRTDIDVVNAGSDIIALSSLNEGTPVSLIEAQASGKPIIATNCGGIKDVVIPNKTALVVEQGDEQGFYDKLIQLVNDDSLRNELGANGPAWAVSKFGHETFINNMTDFYKRLLLERSISN